VRLQEAIDDEPVNDYETLEAILRTSAPPLAPLHHAASLCYGTSRRSPHAEQMRCSLHAPSLGGARILCPRHATDRCGSAVRCRS
jgi:hypothetical protein